MKPANDEIFTLVEAVKDWLFGICAALGAASAFVFALIYSFTERL